MRPVTRFCKGSPKTIADAIEMLAAAANFKDGDEATILVSPLQLPSAKVVWQTLVVYERVDDCFAVPFSAGGGFCAVLNEDLSRTTFEMPLLADAVVSFDGSVKLRDGRQLRAVEIKQDKLPYELSDLDCKIVQITLWSTAGAESRCYRDIRHGLLRWKRFSLPSMRFPDFSQMTEGPGRPALQVPPVKVIQQKFAVSYPDLNPPSEQKISDTLEKTGIRISKRRIRAAG